MLCFAKVICALDFSNKLFQGGGGGGALSYETNTRSVSRQPYWPIMY